MRRLIVSLVLQWVALCRHRVALRRQGFALWGESERDPWMARWCRHVVCLVQACGCLVQAREDALKFVWLPFAGMGLACAGMVLPCAGNRGCLEQAYIAWTFFHHNKAMLLKHCHPSGGASTPAWSPHPCRRGALLEPLSPTYPCSGGTPPEPLAALAAPLNHALLMPLNLLGCEIVVALELVQHSLLLLVQRRAPRNCLAARHASSIDRSK